MERTLPSPDRRSRRRFLRRSLSTVGLGLLTGFGSTVAPVRSGWAAAATPRIGILGAGNPATGRETMVSTVTTFRQSLEALGYVQGETVLYESRSALGDLSRLPELTAELIQMPVDLLVPIDPLAIRAALDATNTIPILCPSMGDPVGAGFVASLARPGGNLTGLSYLSSQLSAKRLDLLKEVVPTVRRVLVLSNPANPPSAFDLRVTQETAAALGVQLVSLELGDPGEYDRAFHAAAGMGVEGIVALETGYPDNVVQLAAMYALPAIYHVRGPVAAGGLLYYGPDHHPLWRRGAAYADKILKGARPADLPIEQASTYDLGINLAAARALNITFPESIVIQATEVIPGDQEPTPSRGM